MSLALWTVCLAASIAALTLAIWGERKLVEHPTDPTWTLSIVGAVGAMASAIGAAYLAGRW
jgi:hypothetical protein